MLLSEYNAMMEAKGTPKVWVVESAWSNGNIHTNLYLTEEEAKTAYDKIPSNWYKKIYRTWDIWGWVKRQQNKK